MLPSHLQTINTQKLSQMEEQTYLLLRVYACRATREIRLYLASNRILRLLHRRCPNLDTLGIKHYENIKLQIVSSQLKRLHLEKGVVKRFENGVMWIYFRKKSHSFQREIESFDFATIPLPNLEDLSLGWAFLDVEVFRGLSVRMSSGIKRLALSGCRISSSTLEIIAKFFQNLETLHIDRSSSSVGNKDFEMGKFFELLRDRTRLKCLQLRSQNGSLTFNAQSFEAMSLGLGNSLISFGLTCTSEVDDVIMCLIARNFHILKDLDLSGCVGISDVGFASLMGHPTLEVIDITGCYKITYNEIARTVETMPRIKKITVTNFRSRTDFDWSQLNKTRIRLGHLIVDINREWSVKRFSCPYCASGGLALNYSTPLL